MDINFLLTYINNVRRKKCHGISRAHKFSILETESLRGAVNVAVHPSMTPRSCSQANRQRSPRCTTCCGETTAMKIRCAHRSGMRGIRFGARFSSAYELRAGHGAAQRRRARGQGDEQYKLASNTCVIMIL